MKRFFSIFASVLVAAATIGTSQAVTYNFNTGYTLGSMHNQNGWVVDNSLSVQPATIIALGGVWGGRAASLGFVEPLEQGSVSVMQTNGPVTPLIGTTNATFSVLFQIQDSDSGYGPGAEARDTFGFRLENALGDNLFSFFLTPFDQDPTPETDTAFHTFSWSTGNVGPTAVLNSPLVAAQEEFAYTLTVNFFDAGLGNVGFNANVNGDGFTGILPGLAGESIKEFGAFWNSTNGASAPGSNFLIFDDVTLIPEPSSILLISLAGIGLVARRKRD